MDIRLMVLKSVAYSFSLALIVGGYILTTFLIFQKLNIIKDHIALDVAILFVLLFTFSPLRRIVEKYTDRLFYKGPYNFNNLLAKLIDIVKKNSRSINALTRKIMQSIIDEMRVDKIAFILTDNLQIVSIKAIGYQNRSKSFWRKSTDLADEMNGIVVYDELDEDSLPKQILGKAGVEVLLPIKTERETIGAVALGPKKSGNMYDAQDLNLLQLIAPHIAIALENASYFREKEQRIAELRSINKMFHHIEHFLDLDKLLQEIVDEAINVIGAEGGSLMLYDKIQRKLSIKTARNLHPLISLNTKIKLGEGIAGTVAQTRRPLIINGIWDKRFGSYLRREDVISAISVPMIANNELIGVLNINRKKNRVEFTDENLNVMIAFAAQAAEAIVKAGYYRQIEKLSLKNDIQFREFTKALARTVDAKDPYTYGHSETVTRYALEIAKEMGLDKQQLRSIEIGGRLHDMGKIGVSESILNKPGPLTEQEYQSVKRHPEIAADILKDTKSLKDIRDLILYHHERFDGRGYPVGLKGKEIPLGARILAIADTFDTITTKRAYRQALSRKDAIEEIKKSSGVQFDPNIVKVFLKVLRRRKLRMIDGKNKRIHGLSPGLPRIVRKAS